MLEGDCVLHHAPWAGDGGSLDTRYILQCLPLLLSSSVYEPVHYDVIIFNAGLHDVDCCNFPKEVRRQIQVFVAMNCLILILVFFNLQLPCTKIRREKL